MGRICNIVLVCEGWRDSAFARGFLDAAGGNRVHDKRNPRGSGHDWVKSQFVEEVRNLARFSEGRGVLGLIDEDGQGVSQRELEVNDLLNQRQLGAIDPPSGRCLLVPTRNLETWLHWLKAQKAGIPIAISESVNYKKESPADADRIADRDCRPAGEFLHSLDHTQMPNDCPPQLVRSLRCLREFLSAVRR